ncbi:UNVERIFIED_CONTAM: AraC family transcriptional regulator [Escherichia coli]
MTKQKNTNANGYILISPNGCHINIINNSNKIMLNSNCFSLIEKRETLSIEINSPKTNSNYDFIELNQNDIKNVIKIMSPFYYEDEIKNQIHTQHNANSYVFPIETDALSSELYHAIKTTNNYRLKIYKLACFLSRSKNSQHLFYSLMTSITTLFSDKIRRIIESDTSKKWNLSTIAKEFYLSEVAIRKKLSAENTSFYQILLDVRMKKAAILILENELQICNISYMVGISSVSHFIKTFNLYYGLTPKKFLIKHKEKRIR